MRNRVLMAVGFVLALGPAAVAQDGLRSASLPERPIASPPPGPDDLFRATPDTYRPRGTRERPDSHGVVSHRPDRADNRRGAVSPRRFTSGYWPYPGQLPPQPTPAQQPAPVERRLQLRVAPGDALVYIDGIFEGTADALREPGALLGPGSHRIRIEASGYVSHVFDVRIGNGETVTHRAVLERDAPSAARGPDVTPGPARESAGPLPGSRRPAEARSEPRLMYVVPQCYAGDRPPAPDTRCDLTQLRTIR